ncbi:MAG: SMC-Scp complex subunit ScpB [Promethearchaeota archaeon]
MPQEYWVDHDEDLRLLEAYLFNQAEPRSVEEIHRDFRTLGLPFEKGELGNLLDALVVQYEWVDGALRVVKTTAGNYQLRMRDEYYPKVAKFTWKDELSLSETRTLAAIAFHQPLTLGELRRIRRVSARELAALQERKFIEKTENLIRTTSRFAEYFDLPVDPEQMKSKLKEAISGVI